LKPLKIWKIIWQAGAILQSEECIFLKKLSDHSPNVQETVDYFEALPDLMSEEWQKQADKLDKEHESSRVIQSLLKEGKKNWLGS